MNHAPYALGVDPACVTATLQGIMAEADADAVLDAEMLVVNAALEAEMLATVASRSTPTFSPIHGVEAPVAVEATVAVAGAECYNIDASMSDINLPEGQSFVDMDVVPIENLTVLPAERAVASIDPNGHFTQDELTLSAPVLTATRKLKA